MDDNRRQFLKTLSAAAIASLPTLRAQDSGIKLDSAEGQFSVADAQREFTAALTVDVKKFNDESVILEISDLLKVCLRHHDPNDRTRQNYPAFKMPGGSVPVLEATVNLHSPEHPDWQTMTIGIPLAMLPSPTGPHEVVLNFSGVRWTMFVDGELLDNDFPFGYPKLNGPHVWKLNTDFVKTGSLRFYSLNPEPKQIQPPITSSNIQYWLPPGHNSWVGDVVTIFHSGRYHIFYLFDRRHHQSKFGKGAHYFEHLSTTNFKSWTVHPAATPIQEQWECIGTGTPFVFDDQLHLSYGLHTGRVYPDEKTTWPAQWDYLKKNSRTGSFNRASPGTPAGATYSVSTDGISSFQKSGITFHPCQNPSVYVDPSGKLRLLANAGSKGVWESDSLDAGWHCVSPNFPPGGDCTFFFRWGNFDYIIGGFTGLWSKPAESSDTDYQDMVAKGLDFYDGSNVPSISEITPGRFLMAAWIPIRGWGGPLVIRELVQFPDGRIGSKWMNEITPETLAPKPIVGNTKYFSHSSPSFLLTFEVQPAQTKTGRIAISFLPQTGEQSACELQLNTHNSRAQFAPSAAHDFAPQQKSLREGSSPHSAGNYAIENLTGIDAHFTVRIIVYANNKLRGTLIDAEIAGQRTMISYRPELTIKHLHLRTEGLALNNLQIAPLKRDS